MEHDKVAWPSGIMAVGTYRITNSWTFRDNNGQSFTIAQWDTLPGGNVTNRPAKLYDDDDRFLANDPLYPSLLDLQSPPLPLDSRSVEFIQAMQPRFGDAYIQFISVNTNGWNSQPTIPFKRNASAYSLIGNVFDSGNLQLKDTDRSEFWAFSVVFGYQAGTLDDGEPDSETPLSGGTIKNGPFSPIEPNKPHGYSAIFPEAIRDRNFGLNRDEVAREPADFTVPGNASALREVFLHDLYGVIAHEVGHAPGRQSESADHKETGIMEEGAPRISEAAFSPRTILRFRKAPSWTK
jgi:hypothetical protein